MVQFQRSYLRITTLTMLMTLCLIVLSSLPASALSTKGIKKNNHLLSYFIEPNWKKGPIQTSDFLFWFTLLNEDQAPLRLQKVVVTHPSDLTIKTHEYDNQPIYKSGGTSTNFTDTSLQITYGNGKGKKLHGYNSKKTNEEAIRAKFQRKDTKPIAGLITVTAKTSQGNFKFCKRVRIGIKSKIQPIEKNSQNAIFQGNPEVCQQKGTYHHQLVSWFKKAIKTPQDRRMIHSFLKKQENPVNFLRTLTKGNLEKLKK
jgi:hypothetical protein